MSVEVLNKLVITGEYIMNKPSNTPSTLVVSILCILVLALEFAAVTHFTGSTSPLDWDRITLISVAYLAASTILGATFCLVKSKLRFNTLQHEKIWDSKNARSMR